jgi:acyl-CoA synthetase (AMP-forming)/AMP-acid ligase II
VHELLGACAQHLPRSHFPDRILFVQSIPLSATGKPDLAAMRAQLARG